MGLGHVDIGKAHCPADADTNISACYGVADVDKKSVMGSGMELRVKQAEPWRKAMIALTSQGVLLKADDWKANIGVLPPRTGVQARLGKIVKEPLNWSGVCVPR